MYYNEFSGEVEIGVFELDGNSTYIMNGLWSDSDDCELLDSDSNLIEALPGTGGIYYTFSDDAIEKLKHTEYVIFRLGSWTSPKIPNAMYVPSSNVKITSATQDAEIYYTIDESIPTMQSTKYTGHFEAGAGTIIKARGFKDGMSPSEIVSYEVLGPAYDVSFSGNFRGRELCDKDGNGLGATGAYHSGETVYFCYFLGGFGCSIEITDLYGIEIDFSYVGDTADDYRIGSFSMPNSAVEININMIEIG